MTKQILTISFTKIDDTRLKFFVDETFVGYVRVRNHWNPEICAYDGKQILFRSSHDAGSRNVRSYDEDVPIEFYAGSYQKAAISAYFRNHTFVTWAAEPIKEEMIELPELEAFERRQDFALYGEAM